jgi:MFS family permease
MNRPLNPYESSQTPAASVRGLEQPSGPWYAGINGYQWLVLVIASLGWIFDVFEGQVLLSSEKQMLTSLVPGASDGARDYYKYLALASFLAGGALGGVFFGALADRIGRVRAMTFTILMYSLFTCVTAVAQQWWQVIALRFLVALGTGGEWAVASALVAEVFPPKARSWSGAIFHGSSTLGTYLAVAAGAFIVSNPWLTSTNPQLGWRLAFVIGALPALLTLWIRWRMHEPAKWIENRDAGHAPQSVRDQLAGLFAPGIAGRTLLGFSLAVIGLSTYWGVHIHGKEMTYRRAKAALLAEQQPQANGDTTVSGSVDDRLKRVEMLGMLLTATGGGLGLLSFGPICERLGRKRAFMLFHAGGFLFGLLLFQTYLYWNLVVLWALLVLFGFWTLGMHAGYAIYFPELFPTRIRSLGAGFCFNAGRIAAAIVLVLNAVVRQYNVPLESVGSALSCLFLFGIVIISFGPETKGTTLAA